MPVIRPLDEPDLRDDHAGGSDSGRIEQLDVRKYGLGRVGHLGQRLRRRRVMRSQKLRAFLLGTQAQDQFIDRRARLF